MGSSAPATVVSEIRRAHQRADGSAAVLGIGTATPPNCVPQDGYVDYYFRVTNSDHLTDLKAKLDRICNKSGIKQRFIHLTEEIVAANPDFTDRASPSLDAPVDITFAAVPELAESAAAKVIAEWGRPATEITHLVFSTGSAGVTPENQPHGLPHHAQPPRLRRRGQVAPARQGYRREQRGARVLVACSEVTLIAFYGPGDGCLDHILGQALFGDGDGDGAVIVPRLLGSNVERCLIDALDELGVSARWNDLFWAIHHGGRAILDRIEGVLGLDESELAASRHVLSEFGNMSSTTVIYVLDELRRRRAAKQDGGEAPEWGVMMAFRPGITIETMVLRAPAASLMEGN
ncbi:Chalcone synthase 1B [Dichanthelium oligosanthes]|uniref:Chalcone synthase 1B n=1 Tax=Dichanthelium oligosanthes TaxID=888268 RepID=A0A1E5UXQ7_9POAL|nr:Chalcone synthase 1B [Dichanthelium oligosanthes]